MGVGSAAMLAICARTPFSTLGMYCRGTAPPTTLSTNSNPLPSGSGLEVLHVNVNVIDIIKIQAAGKLRLTVRATDASGRPVARSVTVRVRR